MGRSQQTFFKRELEKKRAQKKKEKMAKRMAKSENDSAKSGPEIDWSLAPENKTLSNEQLKQIEQSRTEYLKEMENEKRND